MNGLAQGLARRLPFYYGWVVLYSAATTQVARNCVASLTIAVFMIPLLSRVNHNCRFGVNQFCRFTSSAWPRCWAASVR